MEERRKRVCVRVAEVGWCFGAFGGGPGILVSPISNPRLGVRDERLAMEGTNFAGEAH